MIGEIFHWPSLITYAHNAYIFTVLGIFKIGLVGLFFAYRQV